MCTKLIQFIVILTITVTSPNYVFSQNEKKANNKYQFNDLIRLDATPVISQDITGTCWSFSTTSFLESEIIRLGHEQVDLSEMYQVHNIYLEKAYNYVRRHGATQFGEGSLSHDVILSFRKYGAVPQSIYSGKNYDGEKYIHAELDNILTNYVEAVVDNKNKTLSTAWYAGYGSILDSYMGQNPERFDYNSKSYSPQEFAESLPINPDDYVTITSFTHHPFYSSFILEIPDNWSNGTYYNVPLDEFIEVIDFALENGFTLAWDADVSEKTWNRKSGVAIIPSTDYSDMSSEERAKVGVERMDEKEITQEYRQELFDNYSTTDDHLMHIIGKGRDQENKPFYIVKNSWGTKAGMEGFQYISLPYMQLKSIAVMVHKDALPSSMKKKFNW